MAALVSRAVPSVPGLPGPAAAPPASHARESAADAPNGGANLLPPKGDVAEDEALVEDGGLDDPLERGKAKTRVELKVLSGPLPTPNDFAGVQSAVSNDSPSDSMFRRFACAKCGKRFKDNAGLTEHFRVHTGEKPFRCLECAKSFARKSNLTRHFRIHSKDKRFECEQCGKEFTEKHHLQGHLRTHTGEKPFNCNHCGRDFALRSNMLRHMRTHTTDGKRVLPRRDMAVFGVVRPASDVPRCLKPAPNMLPRPMPIARKKKARAGSDDEEDDPRLNAVAQRPPRSMAWDNSEWFEHGAPQPPPYPHIHHHHHHHHLHTGPSPFTSYPIQPPPGGPMPMSMHHSGIDEHHLHHMGPLPPFQDKVNIPFSGPPPPPPPPPPGPPGARYMHGPPMQHAVPDKGQVDPVAFSMPPPPGAPPRPPMFSGPPPSLSLPATVPGAGPPASLSAIRIPQPPAALPQENGRSGSGVFLQDDFASSEHDFGLFSSLDVDAVEFKRAAQGEASSSSAAESAPASSSVAASTPVAPPPVNSAQA